MSYDYIIKQYLQVISNISIVQCKANEITDQLKEKIEIENIDSCNKPFIKVNKGKRTYFTYYGVPTMNELWPFLNALARISQEITQLDEKERELATQISGNIKLFVTPDCTKCPITAELLYQLPLINDKVVLEIIDVETYLELREKFRVMSVPKIVLDDKKELPGGFPPHILLKMLAKSSEP
ncbi:MULTISPECIES: thioredoxin family protein [Acidianus]|uniref:Glutaredoxin n=1 Tax=Candidatus Acidianus copahuensis TaxID=1160895 RepID=A0A031LPL4_9CREN|nr:MULTISPECIES: thioredoxin family protein [Acidianus]EZQ07027.1 glutaredoxin [Candidatus Acidianus copahuensis]NON63095.1 glutaredoxin [Acidianus sp. RZ1]